MPLLAGLLTSLFGGLTGFFATWFAAGVARSLAAIAAIAAMTVVLASVLSVLAGSVLLALPVLSPVTLSIMWMGLPDNTGICIAAMLSADAYCAVFRWGHINVQLALR